MNAAAPSTERTIARVGKSYRHFKGGLCKVIAIAFHTETQDALVVYTDDKGMTWARPRAMFEQGIRYMQVEDEAR